MSRILLPVMFIYMVSLASGISMDVFFDIDPPYFGPLMLLGRLPYGGPGNYFISVIVQLIFISPILLFSYERNKTLTLVSVFIIDLFIQVSFGALSMENRVYEYICTRFLFIMILGFWLRDHMNILSRRNIWLFPLSALSVVYLVKFGNTGFIYFQGGMNNFQNLFVSFYTALLVLILLNTLPKYTTNIISIFFAKCGYLSWHIFLVQMVYFPIIKRVVYRLHILNGEYHDALQYLLLIIYLVFNVALCFLLGFIFHKFHYKHLQAWVRGFSFA